MAEITAQLVKDLREKTGAGMMDCKKALSETEGDLEAAIDWLRKKGLAKAAKKSGRTAAEGLVTVSVAEDGKTGAVIEINSETDFVARNEEFQSFVRKVANKALVHDPVEELDKAEIDGKTIEENLTDLIAKIGENMNFRRAGKLSVVNGVVANYVHNHVAPNMGKIGVLVALESEGDESRLQEAGKQIAMHVAAARPEFLDEKSVDPAYIEREREVLKEQAVASGKPPEIAEKMVEGRLRKYYEEICLLNQISIIDNESRISDLIDNLSKELGKPVQLKAFRRFELGEGVEKEEENFAEEVARAANG